MKKTIKLNESVLRKIVRGVLNEISYNTLHSASGKLNSGWYDENDTYQTIDDVLDSIKVIREFLNKMEESFEHLHGQQAFNYYLDKKATPNEGAARKCQECLDFIERFVERKQAQGANIEKALPAKEAEYKAELLQLARQWNGYSGNDLQEFFNSLSDELDDKWNSETDRFIASIQDPELKQYVEEHL